VFAVEAPKTDPVLRSWLAVLVDSLSATHNALNEVLVRSWTLVSVVGQSRVRLKVFAGHRVGHAPIMEVAELTVAMLVHAEHAVRLVIIGQVPLSSAVVAEQKDAVTGSVRERQVASLIESCGRADGVSAGNLVVAVPHVGDTGPFSGGPLTGSRTKAYPQRVQAEEGNVEREMRIPKSGQVEGIATEVDSHLDIGKVSVPPLILGRDPMSAQHLLQLLTEPLGLAREVL
jgi:hypothetical protein